MMRHVARPRHGSFSRRRSVLFASSPFAESAGYETKTETLVVGGVVTVVRSLRDRMQFSDPDGVAERAGISSAAWPLFGLAWPSAFVLAAHLQGVALNRRRVLEVGCGLGLASIAIHRRDGLITASDVHPLAEAFLDENVRLNGLAPLGYRIGDWSAMDSLLGRFDLIVGSDVLYDRDQPARLAAFIERHAEAAVEVLIVDPDRGNRAAFSRCMAGYGFDLVEAKVRLLPDTGVAYKGRVLSYRR